MEPYIYEPLPTATSIRILRRLGKTPDGLPNFSVEIVDLNTSGRPYYHCLSYTWGNPLPDGDPFYEEFIAAETEYSEEFLFPIVCDGQILEVRRNLHEFLTTVPPSNFSTTLKTRRFEGNQTMLHQKASGGDSHGLFHLICSGAAGDIDPKDESERTPLHLAAAQGYLDCVQVLLKAGASPNIPDCHLFRPRDLAERNGHTGVVSLLDKHARVGQSNSSLSHIPEPRCTGNPDDYIWIDAVCINQRDMNERASQVRLMDRIYSSALYVMVWLGKADHGHLANVGSALSKVTVNPDGFVNSAIVKFSSSFTPDIAYESAGIPTISQEEWDSLAALFLRQYFCRLWVVQEIVFARHIAVYCGEKQLEWDQIQDAANILGDHERRRFRPLALKLFAERYFCKQDFKPGHARTGFPAILTVSRLRANLEGIRQHRQASGKELFEHFSFLGLTIALSGFRATDPRDHCYALLPLHNPLLPLQNANTWSIDQKKPSLEPDYTAPVEHVYLEFAKEIMFSTKNPLIILFLRAPDGFRRPPLPSWVPPFQPGPVMNTLCLGSFDASQGREPFVLFEPPDSTEMQVRGLCVDTIASIVGDIHDQINWFEMLSSATALQCEDYHGTGQSLAEALWRTLCIDCENVHDLTVESARASPDHGARFKKFLLLQFFDICAARSGTENENSVASRSSSTSFSQPPDPDMNPLGEIEHILPVLERLHNSGGSRYIPSLNDIKACGIDRARDAGWRDFLEAAFQCLVEPTEFYQQSHEHAKTGNTLSMTRRGYLGMVPVAAEVGDEVWIIKGMKTPCILRPKDLDANFPQKFQFVGPAYVHGIMHGEAVAGKDEGDFRSIYLV